MDQPMCAQPHPAAQALLTIGDKAMRINGEATTFKD